MVLHSSVTGAGMSRLALQIDGFAADQAANASTAADARYSGVMDALVRILGTEGVAGLFKGLRHPAESKPMAKLVAQLNDGLWKGALLKSASLLLHCITYGNKSCGFLSPLDECYVQNVFEII
eukprot:scaffold12228_cov14-Tisochrysis_lutea.AAC.1